MARRRVPGASPGPYPGRRRLVVVSNRVPAPGRASAGGLATGLLAALGAHGGLWFGWSGNTDAEADGAVNIARSGPITFATVDVAASTFDGYYNGFSNRALWPLFHFRAALVEYQRAEYESYRAVNRFFAQRLVPLLEPDDLVWVQDYHLIPLAEELRRAGATTQAIGFFLHTPFPPAELLCVLARHEELMRAFGAYDLVGFQTDNDEIAFSDYVLRKAGGRRRADGALEAWDSTFETGIFPIGVDVDGIAATAAQAANARHTVRLRDSLGGRALVIGVDRLDYSKGLFARFQAFEHLIERWPEWRGRVTFMQVAPPSRSEVPEYVDIRRELEGAAGRINGRFADYDWTPIRYLNTSYNLKTLAGFYREAQLALVTPLRDGMNLVAKEYVAAQDPARPGVLVLSCFAGAARELTDAVFVNPFDVEATAEAMDCALRMPDAERRARWERMMAAIRRHDIVRWRESFVERLDRLAVARQAA